MKLPKTSKSYRMNTSLLDPKSRLGIQQFFSTVVKSSQTTIENKMLIKVNKYLGKVHTSSCYQTNTKLECVIYCSLVVGSKKRLKRTECIPLNLWRRNISQCQTSWI